MDNCFSKILQQLNFLSNVVKAGMSDEDFEKFEYVILSYSMYFKDSPYSLKSKVMGVVNICIGCKKILNDDDKRLELRCKHKICSENCFENFIADFVGNDANMIESIFCPIARCSKAIEKEEMQNLIGGEDKFKELISQIKRKSIKKVNCKKCEKPTPIDDTITLGCNDVLCMDCFIETANIAIEAKKTPRCSTCNKIIEVRFLAEILSKDNIEKLSEITVERLSKSVIDDNFDPDSDPGED